MELEEFADVIVASDAYASGVQAGNRDRYLVER